MSNELEILAQSRDDILLGEVAGLLHDWQKCIDMTVSSHWRKVPTLASKAQQWQQRSTDSEPAEFSSLLQELHVSVAALDIKTLCEKGMNTQSARQHSNTWVRLLGVCHGIAHVEKELADNQCPENSTDRISTVFGQEHLEPDNLLDTLISKTRDHLRDRNQLLTDRQGFMDGLRSAFLQAWGDTRRPINEVTLWDWSYAVAALYKSELARYFLTGEWRPENALRWRMLRVNFDVLGLYSRAIKIADLLGYRKAVETVCAQIKHLVEDKYPLGNEVYRDMTGIYFTFPDLDLPADLAQEIRQQVDGGEPELAPRIQVGTASGQNASEQLKRLLADQREQARKELAQPVTSETLSDVWLTEWAQRTNGKWEVCPVCRLRPMREKAEACERCQQRRASRMREWLENPSTTIWMDEIADHNDRVALLVGKFGLDDWLSGDLVQTMLVKAAKDNPGDCVPKNPSPARLRRVWETTQRFWEERVGKILQKRDYAGQMKNAALRRARLIVVPDRKEGWKENVPYDGTINGGAISLLWRGAEGHFVTISNLQLAAGDAKSAGELAQAWQGRPIMLSDPDDPRQTFSCTVVEATPATGSLSCYAPHLPLLTSPDRFLALAPANDALDLVDAIRTAYVQEFGKVQNRLPLFLGLVFFPRKMPLAAVMDTGRRLLETPLPEDTWKVGEVNGSQVEFENGIQWEVPVNMGDGTTEDFWYPYFFVEGDASKCPHRFQVREGKYKDRWLAHVSELTGMAVKVCPSRFAYLYLEHSAQRFEFDSEKDGMRLDDLPRLMKMWEAICQTQAMSDTKLRGIQALFESYWEAWRLEESENDAEREAFKQLAETTLKREKITCVTPEEVLNGTFRRCLDIHLRILKRRVGAEKP